MASTIWLAAAAILMSQSQAASAPSTLQAAGYLSSGELYDFCSAVPGDADYENRMLHCGSYLEGASDATSAILGAQGRRIYCLPDGTPVRRLREPFLAYVRAHPESRDYQAASTVFVVLIQSYPCP